MEGRRRSWSSDLRDGGHLCRRVPGPRPAGGAPDLALRLSRGPDPA